MSKLINQVRRLRFEQGEISQQELARRIGISRQTIIAIESGNYNPSIILALKISAYFKIPVDKIFQLNESTEESK